MRQSYSSALNWFIQDKIDDIAVGVKSTALLFGDQTKLWLNGFTSVFVSAFLAAGIFADQTWPYYIAVLASTTHVLWQVSDYNSVLC